ncbi:O-methyltransferase family 3 [Purpureocillium lavendulum]|uniref:O-methyltransferase family 3 n=1 Tax=Purpureocillium lavendulum TaxID=1247861 RepID=A0AB34FNW0_9HYPO|nr:O-methyltransferase family 3 [Purpureocillium lavendulum]
MKTDVSTLYPNHRVAERVTDYARQHSTALPQHIVDYHAWVNENHARAGYMISDFQGQYHVFLARLIRAKRVLEIGVYVGYSALVWAHAVGNDGSVTGLESSQEYIDMSRQAFERHGVNNVEVVGGDALETLANLRPEVPYDLIFIDAQKSGYPSYLRDILANSQPGAASRLLRPGGLIVADNVLRRGLVADGSDDNPWATGDQKVRNRSEYETDGDIDHLREFNDSVAGSPRLENFLMPLYDGVGLIPSHGPLTVPVASPPAAPALAIAILLSVRIAGTLPLPLHTASRSRSRSRSSSRSYSHSGSGSSSQDRQRRRQQQRHKEKKEGLIKGSAGLLLGIGVAAVVAHKFWPKGILYGGKEEWEGGGKIVQEKIVRRRRASGERGFDDAAGVVVEGRRARGRSRDGYDGHAYRYNNNNGGDNDDEYRRRVPPPHRGGRGYYYADDQDAAAGRLGPGPGPSPGPGAGDIRRTRSTGRILHPRTPSEERWRREDEPLRRAREARNEERMRRRLQEGPYAPAAAAAAGAGAGGVGGPPPPPAPVVGAVPPPPFPPPVASLRAPSPYAQERYYRRDGSMAHPDDKVYVVERTPW